MLSKTSLEIVPFQALKGEINENPYFLRSYLTLMERLGGKVLTITDGVHSQVQLGNEGKKPEHLRLKP
jgi:hypothetical protein